MIINDKKKIYFAFLTFSFVLILLILIIEETFFEYSAQRVALSNALDKANEREVVLKDFLNKSEKRLEVISNLNSFRDYVYNGSNKKDLEKQLLTISKMNPNFFKLRYIDETGLEKIRVNRSSYGLEPFLIDENKLQNKEHRYFFKDSKSKPLEKIWFSAIDLNVENKKVQRPFVPTLRAVLPIEKEGQFGGILIINYFMKNFLDIFSNMPLYDMIFYDDNGYTISHFLYKKDDEKQKSWGNSLEHKYNIKIEYPNDYEEILSTPFLKTDSFVSKKFNLPIYGGVNLILQLKNTYAVEQSKNSLLHYLSIAAIVFMVSIFLTYIIVKVFSRALFNLDKVEKLNKTLNNASKIAKIGFWEYDLKTKEFECSDGVYDIYEIEDKSRIIESEMLLSYLEEEDRKRLADVFLESVKAKEDYYIKHKIITLKGNIKYVEQRAKHYFNQNGEIIKSVGSVYDITEKYFSEQKFKNLLDYASDGIHIIDKKGNIVECSHSFAKNLGYEYEDVKNLNIMDIDIFLLKNEIFSINSTKTFETKHKRGDGLIIDVQISAKRILLEGKEYIYASQRDITRQKMDQKLLLKTTKLYENERHKYKTILDLASDGIFLTDIEGNLIEYSKKVVELLGYTFSEMNSLTVYDWDKTLTTEEYEEHITGLYSHTLEFERIHTRKDGSTYMASITANIILLDNTTYVYSAVRDITNFHNMAEQLKMQSVTDELTKIQNRKAYNERMDEVLSKFKRYGTIFSLIIFDIDYFKSINDTYGHNVGDEVLIKLVNVVKSIIRTTDYFFRIGGEEFTIIVSDTNLNDSIILAEKIRKVVEEKVDTVKDKKINVSIGVTEINEDDTVDSIFKRADDYLYYAKETGRNKVSYTST